jgi:pimeloyl-ACP methyl ester carboxylesterase
MSRAVVQPGIEIEYDTIGSPGDPALLLVMGYTAQLTAWDDGFCKLLADGGRFVIRFDNRDSGLSTKLDGQHVDVGAVVGAALTDQPLPPVPYTLSDMAGDAIGLLDHLGIERAHVVGASMGGMIAQTIAIEHPERVLTLTSIMSNTGEPEYGQPTAETSAVLLSPPATDRAGYIAESPKYMVWQSKKYRDADATKERAAADFDRSFYPEGGTRQLAAIYASGRRAAALQQLRVPTLVIHGRDDTLLAPSGGERTAELIDGAHLLLVADMGHDLPEPLWGFVAGTILAHTRLA